MTYRGMKRILLIGFSLVMFNLAIGQTTGNGRLSGIITDPTTNEPVEYATIAIIDPSTNKPINGTVADGKGKFLVKDIPNGRFNVAISFIGFETVNRTIEIKFGNKINNLMEFVRQTQCKTSKGKIICLLVWVQIQ